MSTDSFTAKFTNKVDGLYELQYTGKDCPFLNYGQCSIYVARPWQCRTWPFWPENMDDDVWEKEVASWCPGVGKGRLYSPEEIRDILLKKKEVS
jgi:Fe-S-cluster containining protein